MVSDRRSFLLTMLLAPFMKAWRVIVPENADCRPLNRAIVPLKDFREEYQPMLFQPMSSVNWAAVVNDDLGAFVNLPKILARGSYEGIWDCLTEPAYRSAGQGRYDRMMARRRNV
jgi:hypothetical protein